jgi:uncharacterized protein (UPF0332 family)
MTSENIKVLVSYRIQQAEESLDAAKILLEQRLVRPATNRAYYAMFYAVLALLATKKQETSKHSGAISIFDRDFVKTGLFSKEFSRWIHDAFDLRQRSDYDPQSEVSEDQANEVFERAQVFVGDVKKRLENKWTS